MRVKKIQLKNGYKRFHDLTIDLGDNPSRIIALVGPNGCGKSSVLDGMLFHNNAFGMIGNKGHKDHFYHSMTQTPNFNWQNIIIELNTGNFGNVKEQKKATGKENTIFSFRSPYRHNSNLKVQQSKAVAEIRLNNYGATTTSDIDDKMEDNYRRLNIKFNKYIVDNHATATYDSAKAKIIGDLNASIRNCLDTEIINIGNIDDNKGTLFFKKSDHPKEFEFNVLSSGEKEVVDMLLDLYLRQDEYNDSIFLIDEPELHISTAIQRKLLLEINNLIGKDCQIWIATHSIGFLRALQNELKDDCQIIQFEQGVKWASEVHTLKPIIASHTKWKEIFTAAIDDLSELICPKRIIYCEGKDKPGIYGEEQGFDAKVYNNIFGEKYHDTLFISSGGNTELDQRSNIAFAILSKVFSDLEIWVLKDRDMVSSRSSTENDRILYLSNNPSGHRVLKRREIENYLFDVEVLKEYCSKNNLIFHESEYNNFVTDINNQNIKDEISRIKKYCNIESSINPETFKLNLSKVINISMNIYKELENCIFINT